MRRFALVLAAGCGFQPTVTNDGNGGGDDSGHDASIDAVGAAWAHKRKLTIDNMGLAALGSFPLSVVLDSTRIRYTPTGADLRFSDDAGTPLVYEIESWNTSGKSFVWVRVPAIAANTTTDLWMYYENPNATDGQMPTAVWDDNFVGVWHLVDGHDSTGKNASSNHGATATTGQVGPALQFDGANHYVDTMSTTHLSAWTIEAWMNPSADSALVTNGSSIIGRFPNYLLLWDCNSSVFCQTTLYNGNITAAGTYHAHYNATKLTWTQVAGIYDGSALTGYSGGTVNGQQATTDPPIDAIDTAKIGIRNDLMGPFTGSIDEVRISRVARSADYLKASVRAALDTYITFGSEQSN